MEFVGFVVRAPFMIMFVLLSFFEVKGLSNRYELIVLHFSKPVLSVFVRPKDAFFDLFYNFRFDELFRESPEPLE